MLSLIQEVVTALTPVKQTHTVLLLGLASSGKTSLVSALCSDGGGGRVDHDKNRKAFQSDGGDGIYTLVPPKTSTTLGQNVVELETASTVVTVWDIGGGEGIRPMWKHYVDDADKLVFVIDSQSSIQDIENAIDILLDVPGILQPTAASPSPASGKEIAKSSSAVTKPMLVLATKMDTYGTKQDGVDETSNPLLDDATVAARLETIATTFTTKIDQRREAFGEDRLPPYTLTCLPVSCLNPEQLDDVRTWLCSLPV